MPKIELSDDIKIFFVLSLSLSSYDDINAPLASTQYAWNKNKWSTTCIPSTAKLFYSECQGTTEKPR